MHYSKKDLLDNLDRIAGNDKDSYILLKQWIKDLILSDLVRSDKIDLLRYGKPTFSRLKEFSDTDAIKTFSNLVLKNRFQDAMRLSQYMSYEYDEKREHVKKLVQKRHIYLLSPKLEMTMGGLGHTVRHRANFLSNKGYDVTIINAGNLKNYRYILNHYRSTNQLEKDIKFHNYIEYYSIKNSNGTCNPTLDEVMTKIGAEGYTIKKTANDDDSITLDYYQNGEKKKTELYIEKCLVYTNQNGNEDYFTPDGFKFYETRPKDKRFTLHERESGLTLDFKYKNEFLNHFIQEVCLGDEKPFIVCDSTRQWYNMNRISLKDAFKIGALHGNPFVDFNPEKGLHPHVNHFRKINTYDRIVLLTKSVYDEVVDAGIDEKYLTIIPNFVLDETLEYEEVEKDINKIGIFSRVAKTKQISHMIKAFEKISRQNENAYLEIYGEATDPNDIAELEELKELLKQLNLEDRIQFKGYIEDVSTEMKKSLFSLLTSKEEGFSLATLELMANSTPMISYDIRYGPSDLITDKVDGILLEKDDIDGLAEYMSKLLHNPDKTIEMGKAAKQKIKENFSISAVCPMWEDLFIDIFIEDELKDEIAKIKLPDNLKKLKKNNKKLIKNNRELEKFKSDVLSSKSWKITKPLRRK